MDISQPNQGNPDPSGIEPHAQPPSTSEAENKFDRKRKKLGVVESELQINVKRKSDEVKVLPGKKEEGTLGKKVRLISNCFPLIIPDGLVYHYDVKIKENKLSKSTESDSSTSDTDDSISSERDGVIETDTDFNGSTNGISEAATAGPILAKKKKKNKKYNCINTRRSRQVINTMLEAYDEFKGSYPVYDGKSNLYTRHPLNIDGQFKCGVVVRNEEVYDANDLQGFKIEHYKVSLKPIKKRDTNGCAISLDPLHELFAAGKSSRPNYVHEEAVMALETVLRNLPCMRYVPVGRSFFYPPSRNDLHPLGGGREIWFGYHQSMRLGQWGPMVNLDITATAFYERRPLLNYVAETLSIGVEGLHRLGGVQAHHLNKMNQELKNLRFQVTHLNGYRRKYRIHELTRESANRLKFTRTDNGNEMTINQYFTQRYRPLQFPHLPCVRVKSNSDARDIFLPIEVCEILSQHCNKELTAKQNAEMIKFTKAPPAERFKEIGDIYRKANYIEDPYLKEFEMEVLPKPLEVVSRVLDAPSVRYDHDDRVRPINGSWNMIGKQFIKKACVGSWVLISFGRQCTYDILENFAKNLRQMANNQGIQMNRYKQIQQVEAKLQNVNIVLSAMKHNHSCDLIVIVMPTEKGRQRRENEDSHKALYNTIKQTADTTFGVITQCITADNVIKLFNRPNPSFLSNICQKINAKMGGTNHQLTPGETPVILNEKPVMVMGADVNHPGPSSDKNPKPSLAAVVGSLNANASSYAVTVRSQINKKQNKQVEEIIQGLKDMVMFNLRAFYRHTNGLKPEQIIFYRDGVSEGQLPKVQKDEVRQIREACLTLQDGYEPGITFIVVQKRHHVRFRPQDNRDGAGENNNICPGSVIDTGVTHPLRWDFFLNSHYGLKGTSRPGYYTVIEDGNNLTTNEIQKLTYSLCHTFARCTRSISLPAPVQYAHLAAYRARLHLASLENQQPDAPQEMEGLFNVNDNLKHSMYFL